MNYNKALEYIHSRNKFGMDLGLDRIRKLLKMLGNPQKKLKYIHVAGTNGKGSTTAMIAAVLSQAGYKTGMYISPFVECFNERIQIDAENISDDKLAEYTTAVKAQADILDNLGDYSPVTEFEVVTAVAFCFYAAQKCDYVVLEVGLGGRLDATNVIDCPKVAVISSISYDHTHILGSTLYEIAGEKCGIIKDDCKVVLYPKQENEVFTRVDQAVKEKKASIVKVEADDIVILNSDICGVRFSYCNKKYYTPLPGDHQAYNAATAIAALKALDIGLSDEIIANGIKHTKFIGRLQVLSNKPTVIVDGGHNPDGIDTLAAFISKNVTHGKLHIIMGMLADKNYEYCIKTIAELADVYYAVTPENPRALDAKDNAEVAAECCTNSYAYDSVEEAVDTVFETISDEDTVIVCGSLYMIGGASLYIRKNKLK